MKMRTLAIDALYLNWAIPAAAVPPAPEPLSHQVHEWQGEGWVFLSALLFRNRNVHLERAPFLRLSYPQLDLCLYVTDGDGVPSILSVDMILPRWVRPAVALAARRPVSGGRFDFPAPSLDPAAEAWRWRVEQGAGLEVVARPGGGLPGGGPALGSWDQTVRFFRDRPRAYVEVGDHLQRIDTQPKRAPVWPLTVDIEDDSLLADLLPLAGSRRSLLHSAWLCPEVPMVFDLRLVPEMQIERAMPTPAASVRSCARSMRRPTRWPTGRAAL